MNVEPAIGGVAQTACDRNEPLLRAGNTNCGGCGMSIGFQFFSRAIAGRPVQMVIPACCAIVTAGPFPYSAYGAPVAAATFASAAAMATGLSHVARLNGEDTRVVCWAGDGGTFDIGMATLSAAAERNEDVLYVCYDNEIYGNTGGQRSSATPAGATTTTTPRGKELEKKDIVAILAAHRVPYVATVSLGDPEDAHRKFRQGLDARGFRFLHILAPCPTGWKSEPEDGIRLVRLAVESGLYPLVEVFDGERTEINHQPDLESPRAKAALKSYFEAQGRFRKSGITAPAALDGVFAAIVRKWARLRREAAIVPVA